MAKIQRKNSVSGQGFTLVEVVTVIAILAIIAVLGAKFVVQSTKSYNTSVARAKMINTGRQSVESMSRQLRVALSYSVRITNANACLEFLPIVGGGYYLDPVADGVNGVTPSATITVSPHTVDIGTAQYVSIGAAASAEVYGVAPVSRATLNSRTQVLLTLSGAKTWQRNSLGQHFFLLDTPQAFCVVSGQLRVYTAADVTAASVNLAGAYSILAENVTSPTPFSLSSGSQNRNVVVSFDITFGSSYTGEAVALKQSVMIRNVP